MNMEFANRLAALRIRNGLSQKDLAEKLGVSTQAISDWEDGITAPDTDQLVDLSKIYGLTLDELVHGIRVEPVVEEGEVLDPEDVENLRKEHEDEPRRKIKIISILSSSGFLIATLAYLLCGFLWKGPSGNVGWASMWILFLMPMILISLYMAVRDHKFGNFQITLFVIALYCGMGIIGGAYGVNLWNPFWLLFLLIPIYHSIAGVIDNHRNI